MSLLTLLSQRVGAAFAAEGVDPSYGAVVPSQRPDLAQFQCNGALAAAKAVGRNPRELATAVAGHLADVPELARVEVAGPGFINLDVTDEFLAQHVDGIAADPRVGLPQAEAPRRILIDYGGPNISKALHVGHLRSAIIGDSIKRTLRKRGHDVTGDIHLGDWGKPIGLLIAELRRVRPDLPYFDPDFEGPYPDEPPVDLDELSDLYVRATTREREDPDFAAAAQEATLELQRGRPGYLALWKHFHDVSVAGQRRDFELLGVEFDLWYGESTVRDRLAPMVERLIASGVARESDGAYVIDVAEPDDDAEIPPLILTRTDGSYLYSTTDLATLEMRVEMGYEWILYVTDQRQVLHFVQVFRAARKAGIVPDGVELEHIWFGTVNGPDGRPFKTREGGVLRLSDLLQMVTDAAARRLEEAKLAQDYPEEERREIARKVGIAAVKYGDLSNHRQSSYVFDIDRFASFEGKTGPYLQYGAVRIQSILRNAAQRSFEPGPLLAPTRDAERRLMLELSRLPEVIDRAIDFRAPNHIAEYGYELVAAFNRFYEQCHILGESDPSRRASWLTLVSTTLRQLELLLELLGIEIPERM